jgi:hypothetical protein
MTADGAGLSPALLILIDSNPDASFLPPGDMTGPTDQAVGLDDQFEPVSGVERNCHFEDGAGFRDIKNGAVNYAAAESDRAGFENAATSSSSTIVENDICGPGPSMGTAPFVLRQTNYYDIFRKARAKRPYTNEAPYLLRHSVSSIDLMIRPSARRARNLSIANSSIWSRWILKTSRTAIPG